MPKCGYNRGNFLPQFILSLTGNYILLLQYITARPQRKNIPLSHFLLKFTMECGMTCFAVQWMTGALDNKFSIFSPYLQTTHANLIPLDIGTHFKSHTVWNDLA